MATSFTTHIERTSGTITYDIQFSTNSHENYKLVEDAVRKAVDKERSREYAPIETTRHGHWIERSDKGIVGDLRCPYRCSICGRVESLKEPYCNCGARMDGDL